MFFLAKKFLWVIVFALAGVNVLLFSLLIQDSSFLQGRISPIKETEMNYSELDYLRPFPLRSFGELSGYFSDLAREKGGAYALEVLKQASIPREIDMHLLAHVAGDILYQQEGLDGIKVCTEDFRNACSHSIVVGLFLEQGEAALPKIAKACYQAPGGSGAYTMCFHGLGHGILAYAGYDVEKAVELCKKTGTPQFGHEESNQCISGAIMEIIGGGGHDPKLWASQRKNYFRKEDPLYPCTAEFIPNPAQYLCYLYLTPHLFEAAGTNAWTPTPNAFSFCDTIPLSEASNRDACYGGFGKEFVGFAAERDIRAFSVKSLSAGQLTKVYEFCLSASNTEGTLSCIRGATNSLYWGGENDRRIAESFCSLVPDSLLQSGCFANLIGAVNHYIQDPLYKQEFCTEIPEDYRRECLEKLPQPQ